MRPPLTKSISLEDFQNYYWLKAELQTFCREHGLPASGSKTEITERISHYLTTGKVLKNSSVPKVSKAPLSYKDLSLQTIITKNHRCSEDVRAFFKEKIGTNFRFTVALQKFFKENVGKTYEDAITFWYEENERKKILLIKQRSARNLNTIALLGTFSKIQIIKEKQKLMRLLLGTK
ncbi:SAP domain-containing protein [Bacillus sp. JKS001846]|nr:SAP domain-containing protein [Bacillus sp. JKS001846]